MKQLFIVLAIALVACKKEDPKPEPPKPAPKTYGLFKFTFSSPGSDYAVNLDWDSDTNYDTSFSKISGQPPVTFERTIAQSTIIVNARVIGRSPGGPEKVNLSIAEGAVVKYSGSDSIYSNRTFTLW